MPVLSFSQIVTRQIRGREALWGLDGSQVDLLEEFLLKAEEAADCYTPPPSPAVTFNKNDLQRTSRTLGVLESGAAHDLASLLRALNPSLPLQPLDHATKDFMIGVKRGVILVKPSAITLHRFLRDEASHERIEGLVVTFDYASRFSRVGAEFLPSRGGVFKDIART
jgi:hypothetical protein